MTSQIAPSSTSPQHYRASDAVVTAAKPASTYSKMATEVRTPSHAGVSESDVVPSVSENPAVAPTHYSNSRSGSRSSSRGHLKSDIKKQDASPRTNNYSCLWSEDHPIKSLEDVQCHIFGCVPFRERINLLRDVENPDGFWHKALELDIKQHPDVPWMDTKPKIENTQQRVEFIRYLAVLGIKGERKRIRIIRSELDKSHDDKHGHSDEKKSLKGLSEHNLVKCLASSFRVWRASVEYRDGLKSVKAWRTERDKILFGEGLGYEKMDSLFADVLRELKHKYLNDYVRKTKDEPLRDHGITKDSSAKAKPYDLERDIKVQILQFEPITKERPVAQSASAGGEVDAEQSELDGLMRPYQEVDRLLHDESYKEQFPNQVISVEFLKNEFKQIPPNACGPGVPQGRGDPGGGGGSGDGGGPGNCPGDGHDKSRRLRWFHIPYNNMEASIGFLPSFLLICLTPFT